MENLKNKRIITVATTGSWPGKKDNPNIPLTPEEIAEDVYKCWQKGAAVAHLHMRDDKGIATMDIEKYKETVRLIREHKDCDIILNLTTSGFVVNPTWEARMLPINQLTPELGTMDCGSMNVPVGIFENAPEFLEKLGKEMIRCNVKPEVEIFDGGMLSNAKRLIKAGAIKTPVHFQMCMGVFGGISGTVKNLLHLVEEAKELDPTCTWSCFGVGRCNMEIMYAGIALGGHIRVGMEDNVMYKEGVLATGNVQFVERAVRVLKEFNCSPATPDEAREILGIVR